MSSCNGEEKGINSFALVSYFIDPLAEFLDRLRKELESESLSKAHVTVLPPRPLECAPEEAWRELAQGLRDLHPFRIELGEIEIFPVTNVIYLSMARGGAELKRLHEKLNSGCLAFEEPFPYHPHVTLAQDLGPVAVEPAAALAAARWREFAHKTSILIDRLTFVQNTLGNRWTDLHAFRLAHGVRI
jgi:2'-5' RNA ligase